MDSKETIIICKSCGTKNRIPPHNMNLRPICANCKTYLENIKRPSSSPALFGNSFSYHKYIKNVDVKKLIEINAVFDEAKGRTFPASTKCILCTSHLKSGDVLRLNNGNYICEPCFKQIQTIRYPEIYQRRYESFLTEREARRPALDEFTNSLSSTKIIRQLTPIASFAHILAGISIVVSIIVFLATKRDKLDSFFIGTAVSGFIYGTWYLLNRILTYNKNRQSSAISDWSKSNPEPHKPVLREFHDPTAELTQRDKQTMEVFDYWPGYPPYWNYVRYVVLNSDKGRCQISGCPSRTGLHIHHKTPISQGGSHRIENLVTLCVFHHSLQPDMGHERIWGEVRTQYFSMVRAHYRNGSPVRAHVRRKELATEETLKYILSYYSIGCPDCKQEPLQLSVDYQKIISLLNVLFVLLSGSLCRDYPKKVDLK